jgi:hypothetical protein
MASDALRDSLCDSLPPRVRQSTGIFVTDGFSSQSFCNCRAGPNRHIMVALVSLRCLIRGKCGHSVFNVDLFLLPAFAHRRLAGAARQRRARQARRGFAGVERKPDDRPRAKSPSRGTRHGRGTPTRNIRVGVRPASGGTPDDQGFCALGAGISAAGGERGIGSPGGALPDWQPGAVVAVAVLREELLRRR